MSYQYRASDSAR